MVFRGIERIEENFGNNAAISYKDQGLMKGIVVKEQNHRIKDKFCKLRERAGFR